MKQYLDSSDEELELNIQKDIASTDKSYVKYLFSKFQFHNVIFKDFAINLALAVHNFADRIFKGSSINTAYQNYKLKLFKEDHAPLIEVTAQVLDIKHRERDGAIISAEEKETLNEFDNYKRTNKIDLLKLAHNPLVLNLEPDSENFLFVSRLVSRNNKNTINSYVLENIESNITNVSYKIPISSLKTLSEYHVIKSNGNTQALIPGLGTYATILSAIPKEPENRKIFIENILKIIKNKKPDNDLHNNDSTHLDERLVHLLFFSEMQRNNAVLFTAPIFLKLLGWSEDEKIVFPMSEGDAVSHCRGISKEHKGVLPNHTLMDYDVNNISNKIKATEFLAKEGKLIIKFFTEKNSVSAVARSYDFFSFFTKLEHNNFIKTAVSKDVSTISLNEIKDVASYIRIQNPFYLHLEVESQITKYNEIIGLVECLNKVRTPLNISQDKSTFLKNLENIKNNNKKNISEDVITSLILNIENFYENFKKIQENLINEGQVIFKNITQITEKDTEDCITSIIEDFSGNLKEW